MSDEADDEVLMARVTAGDAHAFDLVTARHRSQVWGLALRMLAQTADAEDVVQDVFIQLWQHAEDWEPARAKLSTWLYRITMNRCLNHLQRVRGRLADDDIDDLPLADPGPGPDAALGQSERQHLLGEAINALPERQRAAIHLVYGDGVSVAEAAAALMLSPKATESLLARARQQLRLRLAPMGVET